MRNLTNKTKHRIYNSLTILRHGGAANCKDSRLWELVKFNRKTLAFTGKKYEIKLLN